MKTSIEIVNGKSYLKLKLNGLGSYLKFEKPLAFDWYDCMGSVGKFFAIFSFSQNYQDTIDIELKNRLNKGEFNWNVDIPQIVKMLSLFENGVYDISYEPEYIHDDNWGIAKNFMLYGSNPILREEARFTYSSDQKLLYSLGEGFYDGISEYFISTQPSEILKYDRIKFYEEIILQGYRPTAIIYNGFLEKKESHEDGSNSTRYFCSGDFILDGHHKLNAYKNVYESPSLIRITKRYKTLQELNFDLEDFNLDLAPRLQKCQIAHFVKNYSNEF